MNIITFITLTSIISGLAKKVRYCNFKTDKNKQCYLKEVLSNKDHNPNQIAVDKSENVVYFSFDTGNGNFRPAMVDIETKKLKLLKGVTDAFAIADHNSTGEMYFGGSNGIYKYMVNEKKLMRLAISNLDVWWLFIRKNIFFIQFPNLNAYVYKDKTIKSVEQLKRTVVQQFVIDFDGNMFFMNGSGLYGVKKGTMKHILLRDQPSFFGMATDNTGQVFVSSEDGIYVVSKIAQKVKLIISVPSVQGITFDRNNHLIYSDSHELVRLVPVSADMYYKNLGNPSHASSVYFCK